jgi:two-component system response regulator DctR
VRTVEVHRARVFDKMQVKSAVELANVLATLAKP